LRRETGPSGYARYLPIAVILAVRAVMEQG